MGNRLVAGSPRHGIPRNHVADREAKEHYQNRAEARPKQIWLGKDNEGHNLGWLKDNGDRS